MWGRSFSTSGRGHWAGSKELVFGLSLKGRRRNKSEYTVQFESRDVYMCSITVTHGFCCTIYIFKYKATRNLFFTVMHSWFVKKEELQADNQGPLVLSACVRIESRYEDPSFFSDSTGGNAHTSAVPVKCAGWFADCRDVHRRGWSVLFFQPTFVACQTCQLPSREERRQICLSSLLPSVTLESCVLPDMFATLKRKRQPLVLPMEAKCLKTCISANGQ